MSLTQVEPHVVYGFAALWLAIAGLLGWWGKSQAEEHGAPGWVGFVPVFLITITLSGLLGLAAIFLLVPVLAAAYRRATRVPRNNSTRRHTEPVSFKRPTSRVAMPIAAQAPDREGKIKCPACGERVKAERRTCPACGVSMRQL